jgi:hypothetical protein
MSCSPDPADAEICRGGQPAIPPDRADVPAGPETLPGPPPNDPKRVEVSVAGLNRSERIKAGANSDSCNGQEKDWRKPPPGSSMGLITILDSNR